MPHTHDVKRSASPMRTPVSLHSLNEITRGQAEALIEDDNWFMEFNFGGQHLALSVDEFGHVTGMDADGRDVALSACVIEDAQRLHSSVGAFMVEGQLVGEKFWVTELLSLSREDIPNKPAEMRYMLAWALNEFAMPGVKPVIEVWRAFFTKEAKRRALDALGSAQLQGAVFKRKDWVLTDESAPLIGAPKLMLPSCAC